jgi:hypothetical protein
MRAAAFVPVTLALPPANTHASPCRSADTAQTELGNGRLVRIGAGVDVDALKRILTVLEER